MLRCITETLAFDEAKRQRCEPNASADVEGCRKYGKSKSYFRGSDKVSGRIRSNRYDAFLRFMDNRIFTALWQLIAVFAALFLRVEMHCSRILSA